MVTTGSNSLINNPNLITKVYFPRLLIPTSAVGAGLMDLMIASLMLLVIMPIYGVEFHLTLIMFLPLVALTAMMAAAVSIFTSALNVKYRDIRHALPFAIQTLMFLTPVIYPVSFLPQRWRWLLMLNPLSGITRVSAPRFSAIHSIGRVSRFRPRSLLVCFRQPHIHSAEWNGSSPTLFDPYAAHDQGERGEQALPSR